MERRYDQYVCRPPCKPLGQEGLGLAIGFTTAPELARGRAVNPKLNPKLKTENAPPPTPSNSLGTISLRRQARKPLKVQGRGPKGSGKLEGSGL